MCCRRPLDCYCMPLRIGSAFSGYYLYGIGFHVSVNLVYITNEGTADWRPPYFFCFMGITGLGAFLRKKCPSVFQAFPATSLYGRRVALDMHLYTYQMYYRNGGDERALEKDVQNLVYRLLRDDITAVCVFDGNTVGKKPEAHRKRREASDKVQAELVQTRALSDALSVVEFDLFSDTSTVLASAPADVSSPASADETKIMVSTDETNISDSMGDAVMVPMTFTAGFDDVPDLKRRRVECDQKIQKLEARAMKPTFSTFEAVKAVLVSGLGEHAVVTAEDDAERHVSYLCRNGDVDFAASGDYDTLVFGSPNVILDFLKPDAMLLVCLDDVIAALGLRDVAAFRDFCILCGCDFCTKIPGVGPVSALKLIVAHGTIEAIYSSGKYKRDDTQDFDYAFARKRFASNDAMTVAVSCIAATSDLPSSSDVMATSDPLTSAFD